MQRAFVFFTYWINLLMYCRPEMKALRTKRTVA